MTKDYKDGGLQAIDFDAINGTLKSFLNTIIFGFIFPENCLRN